MDSENSSQNKSSQYLAEANLSTILDFGTRINSSIDPNFVFNNILLTCMGKFLTTRGAVFIFKDDELIFKSGKGINLSSKYNSFQIQLPISKMNLDQHQTIQEIKTEYGFKLIQPIFTSSRELGILFLGERLNKQPYTDEDIKFLRTILNISAPAIENSLIIQQLQSLNKALNSKVSQIRSLFEMSKEFSLLLDMKNVCKLLSYTIMGNMLIKKYCIALKGDDRLKSLDDNINDKRLDDFLQRLNIENLISTKTSDELDSDVSSQLKSFGIALIVPMTIRDKTTGLVLLGPKSTGEIYSENDKEFLESLGSVAMVSIENARLFKEALEKQKLEEDLAIGREIQQNLFPREIPKSDAFEIFGMNIPSRQVGGDYYDIFRLNDEEILILIADVSGKGVGASLLMANLQAFVKSMSHENLELAKATCILNDLIVNNLTVGKFITFFWGILNEKRKTITYVNAGHNPPILISKDYVKLLDTGGMILGIFKSMENYKSETIQLSEDNLICLFTDGVTEAKNNKDEEYSEERLTQFLLSSVSLNSKDLVSSLTNDISKFSVGVEQSDDITIVAIKVK